MLMRLLLLGHFLIKLFKKKTTYNLHSYEFLAPKVWDFTQLYISS